MQVALFGGRFDPVHNGHVAIAQEVLKALPSVDEVWLIPDNKHHWNPTVASFEDRYRMLQLVADDPSTNAQGKIKVSDIGEKVSQKRGGMTITIDVIRALQGNPEFQKEIATSTPSHPKSTSFSEAASRNDGKKNTYLFIAGSDQLPRLSQWHDYEELHMRLPFLIFPRVGYQTEGELPAGCLWLTDRHFEPMDDSATAVRNALKEGKSIFHLVPKKVEEYIKEHRLYQ